MARTMLRVNEYLKTNDFLVSENNKYFHNDGSDVTVDILVGRDATL